MLSLLNSQNGLNAPDSTGVAKSDPFVTFAAMHTRSYFPYTRASILSKNEKKIDWYLVKLQCDGFCDN